jgi:uncharacterized membrane protein YsdA (DUF1294 family)
MLFWVYVAFLVLASLITLVLFALDKKKAGGQSADRIKEKTLLMWSALGGAVGAWLGRLLFHHKTQKIYFSIVIDCSLLFQLATLALVFILVLRGGALL